MSEAKKSAKPRKMKPKAERPTPAGGIPRDADGWPTETAVQRTVPLFSPDVLEPSPEEKRRIELNRKRDAKARRDLAKAKRERTEADDKRKVKEFNVRTGTSAE